MNSEESKTQTGKDPEDSKPDNASAVLPKRFYKNVTIENKDLGHFLLLDGKQVYTPGKAEFILPKLIVAEKIAAEWQAQGEHINPATMPLTKLANTAIDGIFEHEKEVVEDIVSFATSDLICYRAAEPQELVMKQISQWDPILDWVEHGLGARFNCGTGIVHIDQPEESLERIRATLAGFDAFSLTAMHTLTTLLRSALLMLAHLAGRIDMQSAWQAAHLDEDWQISKWGWDEEAKARRKRQWWELDSASRFYNLLHLDKE